MILLFESKCKIYKSINITEMSQMALVDYSTALEILESHMTSEGYLFEIDDDQKIFTLFGQTFDAKGKIIQKTAEMIKRT